MPDAIITSTASTFGTISGVFSADQSTISGTISGIIPGTLTGSVGVPGPAGAPGQGVPAGGTAGQYLQKVSGVDYATDWVTLNLSAYATESWVTAGFYPLSGNPSGFLTAASLSGYATESWVTSQGYITSAALTGYAPLASPVFTGNPTAPTPTFGDNDTSIATTAFVQAGLLGGTANARNLEVEVRNQSGSTIAAGSIVYISGATGNKPLITLAQANNDANSAQTMGFVKTSIANNGTGFVIVRGELENIDTSSLTEGVQLYLSPTTAGTWTTTKPSAPQHLVYVGIVVRSHPTLGTILVAVQNGYELDELHDVAIGTLANNDLLAYESSTDLWKNKTFSALGLLTSADASTTYAPKASPALTGNITITSNTTGAALFIEQAGTGNILTLHDQATDTNFVAIDANGKVSTIPSEATNGAGFNIAHGVAPTTPVNGDIWTTTSGLFARINAGTQQFAALSTNNTFSNASSTFGSSTAAGTINVASGATISASTKTVNVATGGVVGSTTNTTIGPVLGASTTSIGGTTAASTLNLATGATLTATTKAVNIGTAGVAGSTTNITIGSTTGTSTTTLQGITNGVTLAADTNTTGLATTAFVAGQAGSAAPLVNGTATVGTSLRYARQDHVHPTDTTRAPLASPTFTGTVTIPAGASISGFAPLASPTFTGTPSLPTGTIGVTQTAGNNTTALATTAFVTAAVPAFATLAQARGFTSTTTTLNPKQMLWAMMSANVVQTVQRTNLTVTNTGTISSVRQGTLTTLTRPGTAGACTSRLRFNGGSNVDQSFNFESKANPSASYNFNLRKIFSGRSAAADISNSFYNMAWYHGKADADAVGNLARRGFGWTVNGGAGSRFLVLQVHNGTTLSDVTSSFAVTSNIGFDWDVESDGAGNITLYVNGSSVATSANGPTGIVTSVTTNTWQEELNVTGALTNGASDALHSRGRFAILDT